MSKFLYHRCPNCGVVYKCNADDPLHANALENDWEGVCKNCRGPLKWSATIVKQKEWKRAERKIDESKTTADRITDSILGGLGRTSRRKPWWKFW